jgi:hypothetical protein
MVDIKALLVGLSAISLVSAICFCRVMTTEGRDISTDCTLINIRVRLVDFRCREKCPDITTGRPPFGSFLTRKCPRYDCWEGGLVRFKCPRCTTRTPLGGKCPRYYYCESSLARLKCPRYYYCGPLSGHISVRDITTLSCAGNGISSIFGT